MRKLALVLALICVVALVVSHTEAYYAWAPYVEWGGYGYGSSSSSYWPGYYAGGSGYYGYPLWSGKWEYGRWGRYYGGWWPAGCSSSGYWR
ncbi:MAG: hypothetical protein FJ118_01175 [Deltaproteobacteria bacterium]|nr:hypothetical protein [Deltaproteobacteria bacterium]